MKVEKVEKFGVWIATENGKPALLSVANSALENVTVNGRPRNRRKRTGSSSRPDPDPDPDPAEALRARGGFHD